MTFYPRSHGALNCRTRQGVTGPAEIALRKRIITRALHANVETDPERHGSRPGEILLEPGEQLAERPLPAEQQRVNMPRLRRPRARRGAPRAEYRAPEQLFDRSSRQVPPRPQGRPCLRRSRRPACLSELTPSRPPSCVLPKAVAAGSAYRHATDATNLRPYVFIPELELWVRRRFIGRDPTGDQCKHQVVSIHQLVSTPCHGRGDDRVAKSNDRKNRMIS